MVKKGALKKLNEISFQHQFHIKNIDGKTLLWGKKYSTSTEWGPSSGLAFLKFIPSRQMYASNLLLLQSSTEIHNSRKHSKMLILLNAWNKSKFYGRYI